MNSYSKQDQLYSTKEKKKSTFGKPKPAKQNKNEIIDEDYLKWVRTQPCIISHKKAKGGIGANNMHSHHLTSRNKGRNDYKVIPLIGYLHSWGNTSLHSNTKADFIEKNNLMIDDLDIFFKEQSDRLLQEYIKQGNKIKFQNLG